MQKPKVSGPGNPEFYNFVRRKEVQLGLPEDAPGPGPGSFLLALTSNATHPTEVLCHFQIILVLTQYETRLGTEINFWNPESLEAAHESVLKRTKDQVLKDPRFLLRQSFHVRVIPTGRYPQEYFWLEDHEVLDLKCAGPLNLKEEWQRERQEIDTELLAHLHSPVPIGIPIHPGQYVPTLQALGVLQTTNEVVTLRPE